MKAEVGKRIAAWPLARIDQCCEIISGATPDTSNETFWNGDICWVTPKDLSALNGHHYISETPRKLTEKGLASCSAAILPADSVLFSSRAPIGLVAVNAVPMATNQGFKSFVPKRDIIAPQFLFWWLRANRSYLESLGNGATFKEVSKAIVSKISIPLPPLPEQKRIAAILDKADAIRRKRQEALRLTDDFLRSLFLEMFGDLQTNSKGWPVMPLARGVMEFEGGRNLMPIEAARPDGVRVLKVSAVTSGEYLPSESKSFAQYVEVDRSHIVREGDLLISRANTAELVGAVAYVWKTDGLEMLPDKLWRFVWPTQRSLEPMFVLHLARSPYFRRELIARATGSSGSMKNIGKGKMLEIPVPYPPLSLQQDFARAVVSLRKASETSVQASKQAEALFLSLQHRAFSGELRPS